MLPSCYSCCSQLGNMSVVVCAPTPQQFSLAKCPTNVINTGHSYNPHILYHQSSWGPTLRVSVSLSKAPSMLRWKSHQHTRTHLGSYSYNRWKLHVTDKQGHNLEESCVYFQLCCSAEPAAAACVLAPLTELPPHGDSS